MDKQYKAIIKLLGAIVGQLIVIASNLAFSNVIKTETGVRRTTMFKENSRVMKSNLDAIDKIVKEACDD